jgi:hypothetical protein
MRPEGGSEVESGEHLPERVLRAERDVDVQLRQQVDELLGLFAIGPGRKCPLGRPELALAAGLQRGQFAEADPDLSTCVGVGLQGLQVGHLSSDPDGKFGVSNGWKVAQQVPEEAQTP